VRKRHRLAPTGKVAPRGHTSASRHRPGRRLSDAFPCRSRKMRPRFPGPRRDVGQQGSNARLSGAAGGRQRRRTLSSAPAIPMPPVELRQMVGPPDPDYFDNPAGAPIYPDLPPTPTTPCSTSAAAAAAPPGSCCNRSPACRRIARARKPDFCQFCPPDWGACPCRERGPSRRPELGHLHVTEGQVEDVQPPCPPVFPKSRVVGDAVPRM
jgi:hypothetical protein